MLRSLVVLLALLPVAAAGPVPAIYFFGEGDAPAAGQLSSEEPADENHTYAVIAPSIAGPSLWFGGAGAVAEQLRGPVIIGVWPEAGTTNGNITASVYLDKGDGPELIGQDAIPVQFDPESIPEPTSLVPPDPSDPEGAILHLLAQAYPAVAQAPMVFQIGPLDVEVPEGANLSIGFGLESPELIPIGASIIKYGATTAPSFAYIPWYSPDPVPAYAPPGGAAGSGWEPEEEPASGGSMGEDSGGAMDDGSMDDGAMDDGEEASEGEDSPTVGVLLIVATLLGVTFVLRRR